jgi:iron-sulfur cluster insertion protein
MNITFTEAAINKLDPYFKRNPDGYLKIYYDIDGCGCVVNGVSFLWFVKDQEEDEVILPSNYKPVLMQKGKEVFFDEELKIDFKEQYHLFQLKSPNQMINPRMTFVDKY